MGLGETAIWKISTGHRMSGQIGKKAELKVGEHFTEENLWGKGAIAFLEGISEDEK
jgi:hypothetical protein